MSNLKSGIAEWLICGTSDSALRRKVVAGLSRSTPHSLVLDADLEGADRILTSGGSRVNTRLFECKPVPEIALNLCTGCGRCVGVCPVGALKIENRKLFVDPVKCTACGACADACRRGAISTTARLAANFHVSTSSHGRVVHADLMNGVVNSPEIVEGLRNCALDEARRFGVDVVIIDAPCVSDASRCGFFTKLRGVVAVLGSSPLEIARMRGMVERIRGMGIPLILLSVGASKDGVESIPEIDVVEGRIDMDGLSLAMRGIQKLSVRDASCPIPAVWFSEAEVARLLDSRISASEGNMR